MNKIINSVKNNKVARYSAIAVLGLVCGLGFVAMTSSSADGGLTIANFIGLPVCFGSGYVLTKFDEVQKLCDEE